MFGHDFPYLDTRDINLNWLLINMKTLVQDWTTYQLSMNQQFSNLTEAFNALKAWVESYFENLDVSAEIEQKIDNMAVSGELGFIMRPIISGEVSDWLETHITEPTDPVIDKSLSVNNAAADARTTGIFLRNLQTTILDSLVPDKAGYFVLEHGYINASGVVQDSSDAGSDTYHYSMLCVQAEPGEVIRTISCNNPMTYGFFTDIPAIGSETYNNTRYSSGTDTEITNITMPDTCHWIGVRIAFADGTYIVDKDSFLITELNKAIKSMVVIRSGDLNDYTDNGIYVHAAGTEVENAPDTGGVVWVATVGATTQQYYYPSRTSNEGRFYIKSIVSGIDHGWKEFVDSDLSFTVKSVIYSGDLDDYRTNGLYVHSAGTEVANAPDTGGLIWVTTVGSTTVQYYYPTRVNNEGKFYIRSIVTDIPHPWYPYFSTGNASTKIAFFGDSILYGSIKTFEEGTPVNSRANPTPVKTIGQYLGCNVSNFAVGGMGYITQAQGNNIYELLQATDLTGYTHAVFMAGDNDSTVGSAGIGTYLDTDADSTIMGQIYNIITYLHTTYPDIIPIFITKNNKVFTTADGTNKTYFGSFPTYYYDYTYGNGFSIKALNTELEKMCEYYGMGYVDFKYFGSGYILESLVGADGTHYTQGGYDRLGEYIAGQLRKYI